MAFKNFIKKLQIDLFRLKTKKLSALIADSFLKASFTMSSGFLKHRVCSGNFVLKFPIVSLISDEISVLFTIQSKRQKTVQLQTLQLI